MTLFRSLPEVQVRDDGYGAELTSGWYPDADDSRVRWRVIIWITSQYSSVDALLNRSADGAVLVSARRQERGCSACGLRIHSAGVILTRRSALRKQIGRAHV